MDIGDKNTTRTQILSGCHVIVLFNLERMVFPLLGRPDLFYKVAVNMGPTTGNLIQYLEIGKSIR